MPVVIGSNIASLRAQRELHQVDGTLGRVFERLSSGQRINRASDDAAGLSMVSTLGAKARVLNRAKQNLSDAQSLLAIADGAYDQTTSLLVRMSELAEQAANGTLSSAQRKTLDLEYQALSKEIGRISSTTSFNGLSLAQGTQRTRIERVDYGFGVSDNLFSTSGDGRFQVGSDFFSGSSATLNIRDSLTNELRTVAIGDALNGDYIESAAVLANGDVVISRFDGLASEGVLSYYSWETGRVTELARGAEYWTVAASADGSTAAFSDTTGRISTIDLKTKAIRTYNNPGAVVDRITLSSDGRYVGVKSSIGTTLFDFRNPNGSITTNFHAGANNQIFGISTSGVAYFASSSNLSGQNPAAVNQIFSFTMGSGTLSRLTNMTAANGMISPTMSVDGSSLYFISANNGFTSQSTGGNRQLFKFDLNNPGFSQLTAFTTNTIPSGTSWISGDGSKIMYTSAIGTLTEFNTTFNDTTFDFEAGFGANGNITASLQSLTGAVKGLGAFNLTTSMLARAALDRMQANIATLTQSRGILGAAMSRLTIGERLAGSQRDEAISASGRISNADIGQESAELARATILKQAGAAILAQANQQPALAVALLRN